MNAPFDPILETGAPEQAQARTPEARLISLSYLVLRGLTAAFAVATGFVQTFVFARVLDPERFAVFIVTAAVAYSLWIADLGLAKIAFVNLRVPHLAATRDGRAAREAGAVVVFYILLGLGASLVCFAAVLARTGAPHDAFDLALFLCFVALNLPWSALRSISLAVDLFVFFERLELLRRVLSVAALLAMLAGLPLTLFVAGMNVLWAVLLVAAIGVLGRRGALALHVRYFPRELHAFLAANWPAIRRSATGALSELFVVTFPYYVVPIAFGLGAGPIILDTVFKIFRGACVIFAAVCDLAIPGQTRAYNAGDARRLVLTTLIAVGLCAIPALCASALLIFGGEELYRFLLRTAASVPPQVTPIVVVLLLAGIFQIVAEALLQYTGYFRSLAWNGVILVAMMVVATIVAFAMKLGLVGFLACYATAYALGAAFVTTAAILGPFRAAAAAPGEKPTLAGLVKALRTARPQAA